MVFFSLLSLVSEKRDGGQLLTNQLEVEGCLHLTPSAANLYRLPLPRVKNTCCHINKTPPPLF